jgi:hypothetical protein
MGVGHQGGSNSKGDVVPANLLVDDFNLQQDILNPHQGLLIGSGSYSSKSVYGCFLLGPQFLHLGSGFGNLEPLSVANSLFGWQLRAPVGQLIALQKEGFLTRLFVNYVIKLMKQHSIPWLLVFSQGRFGQLSFMCWACSPLHRS